MYHYVRPVKETKYPELRALDLGSFIRQIEYLKKNYSFTSMGAVLDCIYNNGIMPKNSVLLTFDDGLKDCYLYVYPILKKMGIQGSFFPCAESIEKQILSEPHKIHFILEKCKDKQSLINEISSLIDNYKEEYNLNTFDSYFSRLAVPNRFDSKEIIFIKRILQRELPRKLRIEFTNHLFNKFVNEDQKSFSNELYLSFNEIKEMTQGGMYFGSHGYSHEWLTFLSSRDLEIEIENSLNFHSKIKKKDSQLIISYPYGDYSDNVIERLKARGFNGGLTTKVTDAILIKENAFLLSRYDTNDFPQ
jgi:peptidoglycan/xylan/chitin deacetylase (PgdA/CDA1 family)